MTETEPGVYVGAYTIPEGMSLPQAFVRFRAMDAAGNTTRATAPASSPSSSTRMRSPASPTPVSPANPTPTSPANLTPASPVNPTPASPANPTRRARRT